MEMKECSFQPKLKNLKSGIRSQTPIHERIGDMQREKNDNLQKLKVRTEQEQTDLTFQPQVNEKSKKLVELKNSD